MIELIGEEGSAEYEAAQKVREAFVRCWPGIDTTPASEDHVKIIPNVKLSGQKVSDIDIVVIGLFKTKRYIVTKAIAKDAEGKSLVGAKVRVRSLLMAIEVKDHGERGLDIQGGGVRVRYKEGWKSATGQNHDQLYALRDYVAEAESFVPWTYRCLMLRGISELPKHRGVPQPTAGTVAANFDLASLLMAAALVTEFSKRGHEYLISTADDGAMESLLEAPLFKPLEATALDRKRMDRISSRPREAEEIAKVLGSERVHLRGHGGTGKTILMLQSAYQAFQDRGVRTLVLTFNVALAADIERTLALMKIPSDGDDGGITVRTVVSFMYSWFHRLGISEDEEPSFADYEQKCREAIAFLDQGAISSGDLEQIKLDEPIRFDFDAIFIDEAQDWPQAEADLLSKLYGTEKVSLANGLSQLVRGAPTNWDSSSAGGKDDDAKRLKEGLRMKANLCRFANALAEEVGLPWKVTTNSQAPGGRVIVRFGKYEDMKDLQAELLREAVKANNMPIDLLHCVPPSNVSDVSGTRSSSLAKSFADSSWNSWDAVDEKTRRTFPRPTDLRRIIQYESCRGLEGWSVVLDGLDEFWELKRQAALAELQESPMAEEKADAIAWRWVMIPITRPIDTLIITLRSRASVVASTLKIVADSLLDIVELHD